MSPPLEYDTLPPHSRLQRESIPGLLKITAAAEEPGPRVGRQALLAAAIPAAFIFAIVLLVGFAVFGAMYQAHRRWMSTEMSVALLLAFVVFCAALFALLWRTQFSIRLEEAHKALRQSTILAVSKGRLIVETTGPLGAASHDWRDTIRTVRMARDRRGVNSVEVELLNGASHRFLAGRDEFELRWVIGAVHQAMYPDRRDAVP